MSKIAQFLAKFHAQAKRVAATHLAQFPIDVLEGLTDDDIAICDLGQLQAAESREFALLGRGDERVLIAGQTYRAWIPERYVYDGYLWFGHSHPGDNRRPSPEDRHALRKFNAMTGQERSVIVTETGKCESFTSVEDLSQWLP